MRADKTGDLHLTYCTNIHPGEGLPEVLANLRRFAPALRERLAPGEPFGIGLRLSGRESAELLEDDNLCRLRRFLRENGLYVFTLNGFPYGPFHRRAVKADVHAPDWREEERVLYTLDLAEILAYLLPGDTEGGISTSPLSYKPWVDVSDESLWERLTRNVARVAGRLARIRRERGKLIHLDIEPEPDGLLENAEEVVRFYEDWLLPLGSELLSKCVGVSPAEARGLLLEHVRVCLDTCHMALAYEEPEEALDRFSEIGIKVGKVQISSALKLRLSGSEGRAALGETLRPFTESTYLHQVIQRNHDGALRRYLDLPDALPHLHDPQAEEWRIHFHVPVFIESYGALHSTQDGIRRTLSLLRERGFCRHLEIETYTWEVLPQDLKLDLLESIGREYEWVLDVSG